MSRNSDPVMTFELGLEEVVVNIMCACAPRVGCIENEKENVLVTYGPRAECDT